MKVSRFVSLCAMFISVLIGAGCDTLAAANPTQQANLYPTMVQGSPLPTFSGSADIGIPVLVSTQVPGQAAPTPTLAPLSGGWTPLAAGIAYRQMGFAASSGQVALVVVRITPGQASLKVYYTPGQAHSITDWQGALPTAKVILNGGYFDTAYNALGMLVSGGQVYGSATTRSDAGMLQVVGSAARVRSLWLEPLGSADHFDQALQAFPILTAHGQAAPTSPDLDRSPNRRTAIATDSAGNILLFATAYGTCTLSELSTWLAASGLSVDTALNLDGGSSTALFIATGGAGQGISGLKPIPAVIAVFSP